MFSLRSIFTKAAIGLAFLASAVTVHSQINANQILWPTGVAGCVYAPATNTCVANGGGGGGGTTYETRPLKTVKVEGSSCAAGATCSLMSVSGAGSLAKFDLAVSGSTGAGCANGIINIVADGTLVVSAPAGIIFGVFGQGPCSGSSGSAQTFGSPKETLTTVQSYAFGGAIGWIIPYSSSMAVFFTNGDPSNAVTIFSNLDYYSGSAPAGLYPSQWVNFNSYYASQTVAQYADMPLLPSTPGAGALESVQLYVQSGSTSDQSFLEGDPTITADSNAYTYNGTEDFFCGNYYFVLLRGNISGSCGAAYVGTATSGNYQSVGGFRFFDPGQFGTDNRPILFGTSLALDWPNGQSGQGTPGTVTAKSLVTYYTTAAQPMPTLTGSTCSNSISGSSTTMSCSLNVLQAGDLVLVNAIIDPGISSSSATCGTLSTLRSEPWASGGSTTNVLYVKNASAGSCTVTLNYSSATNSQFFAVDIANADATSPFDDASCASSPFCTVTGSGSILTGAAITTAGSNELIVGLGMWGSASPIGSGAGWNFLANGSNGNNGAAFTPGQSAGTYTPAFSGGGTGQWVTTSVAIKP